MNNVNMKGKDNVMLTLQIASDLHIEYQCNEIPDPLSLITPSADILILAGDIGSFYKFEQLKGFLEKLCPHFQTVLYIPGNHEYYYFPESTQMTMEDLISKIHKLSIPNLHVLDKSSVCIGDVCIAGCTLWSEPMVDIPKYIVRVHKMNTQIYKNLYDSEVKYVKKIIQYCKNHNLQLVMVTHHCPTYLTLSGAKKRKKFDSLYASNLDHLLSSDQVHTWIAGHIHHNFDFVTENGTRVVSNQKGKPKDKVVNFKTDFTINV